MTASNLRVPLRDRKGRPPNLSFERRLFREGYELVGGIDEVGRGAWAGPLVVGVVVVASSCRAAPRGIRDSKELSPLMRETLEPRIQAWCAASASGLATAQEVDALGVTAALRLAANRALRLVEPAPEVLLLDGSFDYLSVRPNLFDVPPPEVERVECPPRTVHTLIGGDRRATSIAAASIVAKVFRDALMTAMHFELPEYGFAEHRGYVTPEHRRAVRRHGLSTEHRRLWRTSGSPPAT